MTLPFVLLTILGSLMLAVSVAAWVVFAVSMILQRYARDAFELGLTAGLLGWGCFLLR